MAKAKRKKSKKKVIVFGLIGLLLVVVIGVIVLGGDQEKIITVQTEKVEKKDITQVVAATGKIYPINQVVITPEVNGEIVELPVEEGQKVSKGQLLIRIKPDIYIAQRNRAQANLQSAQANLKVREANLSQVESEYKRIQGLYEKNLASDKELEQAKAAFLQSEGQLEAQKAAVYQAQESLKEAEENLAKTQIYSPLHGTVSQLNVELGERVLGSNFTQGTNLMTVANLDEMEARVEVDENDVVLVSIGDTSRIEIDAFQDRKFNGIVYQIGNTAQSAGLGTQDEVVNFEVKIKLVEVDPEIRPGMSCDSDIETDTQVGVLAVPIQSVTARLGGPKDESETGSENDSEGSNETTREASSGHSGNGNPEGEASKPKEVVFIVDESLAKMIQVETGISDDKYIQIKSGLEEGQEVISGPYRAISKELEEDVKVSVEKKGNRFQKSGS